MTKIAIGSRVAYYYEIVPVGLYRRVPVINLSAEARTQIRMSVDYDA